MKSDSSSHHHPGEHHSHAHDHKHGEQCSHGDCDHDHGDSLAAHDHGTDQSFFFYLKIFALFVWGGVLLYFYSSGRVDHFLSGEGTFRVQTAIAGLGLFVLGLFNVLNRKVQVDCGHDHGHSHTHDHDHSLDHSHAHDCEACDHDHVHDHAGHGHHPHDDRSISGQLSMLIILLLPVTAAAMASKDDYSDAFKMARMKSAIIDPEKAVLPDRFDIRTKEARTPNDRQSTGEPATVASASGTATETDGAAPAKSGGLPEFTLADLESFVKRSDDGNFMISLIELFYSAGDVEVRRVLNGQPVETVAQVVPDTVNNPNGTRLRAFRMFMQCCAADSRPVSIAVEFGKAPPTYKEMGWYKLVGTMDFQTENGIMTPILTLKEMIESKEPDVRIQ